MRLINLKNNQVVCTNLRIGSSFRERLLGLLYPGYGSHLMLKTRFGIHTFFLKKPIDVVVLDDKNKVVKIKQGLRPFSLFFWNPKFLKVIEIPEGAILKYRISLGDTLSIS